MEHHFDTELAEQYGVNCAIIHYNIKFWCLKNKANGKNFNDNNWWTYNSVKAWKELFPYLGESQIKNAIKKLEEVGIIGVGEYNTNAYDRTKWYCLLELEVLANGDDENSQPIPDNKPDKKTDNIIYDDFLNIWNEFATIHKKPNVLKLSSTRKKKIFLRHKDFKDFKEAFKLSLFKASKSTFLKENKFFNFDWLIENDNNIVKVIEDKYKNEQAVYK